MLIKSDGNLSLCRILSAIFYLQADVPENVIDRCCLWFNRRLANVMQEHCHTKYGIRLNCTECSQCMLPQIIRMMNVVLIEIEHNGNFRDNNSNCFSVSVKNFTASLPQMSFRNSEITRSVAMFLASLHF